VQTTDARVIAATNVDLEDRMRKGKFREDLYYRLNTVPIHIPPLKERREDIYLLFRKFANDMADHYRIDPVRLDEQARFLLENYRWPGNIRELKNVAEQISILSEQRLLSAEDLVSLIPNIGKRNLPMIQDSHENGAEGFKEREILFKFLFEMKNDLNDLKNLVFELVNKNDLQMPDTSSYRALRQPSFNKTATPGNMAERQFEDHNQIMEPHDGQESHKPIIIGQPDKAFDKVEVVEESLNIIDMEKDLILKALKKHNGRRKEAALDLGISERTLYRKIKEYDLQ
jgi:DNA-binding NtrC family response regulator